MTDLKPCPFCGGKARTVQRNQLAKKLWYVQCDFCDASQHGSLSEEAAIAAWNRRPHPTAPDDTREVRTVPVEPTEAMLHAAEMAAMFMPSEKDPPRAIWSAMLQAAPPSLPERGGAVSADTITRMRSLAEKIQQQGEHHAIVGAHGDEDVWGAVDEPYDLAALVLDEIKPSTLPGREEIARLIGDSFSPNVRFDTSSDATRLACFRSADAILARLGHKPEGEG